MNQYYNRIASMRFAVSGKGPGRQLLDPRTMVGENVRFGGGDLGGVPEMPNRAAFGKQSIQQMAMSLAQSYGLPVGRGQLVDEAGNFLVMPEDIANASGGKVTLGEAAAKMNYIGQALSKHQTLQQQQKGIGAIQAGLSAIQSRGRGSAAALQTGLYQDLADLYSNQEFEAADFSYFIQKEQLDIQRELQERARRMAKKQAKRALIGGLTGAVVGLVGGLAGGGVIAGLQGAATGYSVGQSAGAGTGYF